MSAVATEQEILDYWFGPLDAAGNTVNDQAHLWWQKQDATDAAIKERFERTVHAAAAGELNHWIERPTGHLALIVTLDQFPRNIYRGTAQSFAYDKTALTLSRSGIERNVDLQLPFIHRVFFYLPLEHAEDRAIQAQSVGHFVQLHDTAPDSLKSAGASYLDYAKRHQVIIDRFGRFPHRNEILGRTSTPEEIAFLQEPNSSF